MEESEYLIRVIMALASTGREPGSKVGLTESMKYI
jgi:hypothetical protein